MTPPRHADPAFPAGDSGAAEPVRRNVAHAQRVRPSVTKRILLSVAGALAVVLVAVGAFAAYSYVDLSNGLHRSAITLPGGPKKKDVAETNILVMGLDSRLDENGNPLPADVYNALHAGGQGDGGYNANVLMLIHIPAGGKKAVGISIPRDDYAPLSGSPDGVSQSKIKEAYGLALDQKLTELTKAGVAHDDAYQQARTFARQTELQTVSDFLGGVRIDHFIEVTMAAFYQVAQAVQPVTVCIAEDTQDPYSGADFKAGVQQLSASQAVSFVRQRRDENNTALNFTDLDRERRQQAFIVSLATKLKKADTFANPATLESLISAAKQNIALDSGFDLLSFASEAQHLAGGNITFTTLPITGYGVRDGKDVNLVDPDQIHAIVQQLLNPPAATATPTAAPGATASGVPVPSASAAAPAPTPSATKPPGPNGTYTDPTAPLPSGGVPCVK
ncbi:LCP family protein [Leifsonia shinshuensis]|uniref:LCP family protein required for cell wall assembly n=1 Tax=Leifsonia shinshuensis TaxID=150026 RepID=A0A853CWM3_9MICO|nr:LCP family protein [Leifsonia shinshuensis]NYJ23771.1 LCP family protein required for cell wall assembly [Leifsonia shinshuensis]